MRHFRYIRLLAIAAIILLASSCFAQVIQRPTKNVDGGATTAIGCNGANVASTAMPLGYDNAGISTSNTQISDGTPSSQIYQTRIFSGWTAATYNSVSLNVYASSEGWRGTSSLVGEACIAYSIDNGVSWTSLQCDGGISGGNGFGPGLFTATLSSTQDVSKVQVGICTQGHKSIKNGSEGEDSITVNDIYLLGTVTAQPGGAGSSVGNAQRGVVVVN